MQTATYNSRLQATQLKLSIGGTKEQRYDYLYREGDQSNGTVDQDKNTGRIGRAEGFINCTKQWQQRFSYDALGRLTLAGEYRGGNSNLGWKADNDFDRYCNRMQTSSGPNYNFPHRPIASTEIDTATNGFISKGPTPVTYDAEGDITEDAKFRYRQCTHGAKGRQTSSEHRRKPTGRLSLRIGKAIRCFA